MEKSQRRGEIAQWTLMGCLALLISSVNYSYPYFRINEFVNVLEPYLLLDPELLAADPFARKHAQTKWLLNNVLSVPLGFMGPLLFTVLGRYVAGIAVVAALARLCKSLGMGPRSFFVFFCTWFYCGQYWLAGEWVLDSLEAKPFSYALIFLALHCLLRGHLYKAAALAGLSTTLHVLVGGWAVVGLTTSAVWVASRRSGSLAGLVSGLRFGSVAVVLSLPGLIPALQYSSHSLTSAERRMVIEANASHLDPAVWFGLPQALFFFSCWGCTLLLMRRWPRRPQEVLMPFVFTTGLIFSLGLIAPEWFLIYYPFRLADALIPLFFALSAVLFLRKTVPGKRERHLTLAVVVLVGAFFWQWRFPIRPVEKLIKSGSSWYRFLALGEGDEFAKTAAWVKENTSKEALFVAPPWLAQFWLTAERPMVVCSKHVPHNHRIRDWRERMVRLLGERHLAEHSDQVGRLHFESLSLSQLQSMQKDYGSRFYLTTRERPEFARAEVYQGHGFSIYDLDLFVDAR